MEHYFWCVGFIWSVWEPLHELFWCVSISSLLEMPSLSKDTVGVVQGWLAKGVLCPPLLQGFFNQPTYNRWQKCHDDTLTIVTIWWIPSLWHGVTPPLKNPGYAPVVDWVLLDFENINMVPIILISPWILAVEIHAAELGFMYCIKDKEEYFIGYPKTEQWVEKNEVQLPFFLNQLRSVWIPDETHFWVFDIASQSINNSKRKSKQKFIEFFH